MTNLHLQPPGLHSPSLQTQLQQQIMPDDVVANSIFGTSDINAISDLLNGYCQQQFGSKILYCTFAYFSVGATFIVELSDSSKDGQGQPIVLKAYGTEQQALSSLQASFQVLQALAKKGFPCPNVLQFPQQIGSTIFTAQTFCDDSRTNAESLFKENSRLMQARSQSLSNLSTLDSMAHVRRTMADYLAKLIRHSKPVPQQDLPIWMELHKLSLWHRPHSALFDFEKTTAGAEWIDDIAQQAKQILRAATGPLVIGHADWSLQNMSFHQGKLTCVYDWDSLRVGLEPCFVGGAARVYRYDWRFGPPATTISIAEVQDFIRAYESARERPFSPQEHQVLGAAIVYTAAYGTRCSHALQIPNDIYCTSAKSQLQQFADYYLS